MKILSLSRELAIAPAAAVGRGALLDAIGDALERKGNRVRMGGRDRIVFDGPGPFGSTLVPVSPLRQAARAVAGGVVTVDRVDPEVRIRLELRISVIPYLLPAALAVAAAAGAFEPSARLPVIALALAFVVMHTGAAVAAYRKWVRDAARRVAGS
jgi:hypothetical protein